MIANSACEPGSWSAALLQAEAIAIPQHSFGLIRVIRGVTGGPASLEEAFRKRCNVQGMFHTTGAAASKAWGVGLRDNADALRENNHYCSDDKFF